MKKGFTLIELLIAILLSLILIGTVATIFFRSSEIVGIGQAGSKVYDNARLAIDKLDLDLTSALPPQSAQQRFILINGFTCKDKVGAKVEDKYNTNAEGGEFYYGYTDCASSSGHACGGTSSHLQHSWDEGGQGPLYHAPCDLLSFKTAAQVTVTVGDAQMEYTINATVVYRLGPETWDPERKETARTKRALFVFRRHILDPDEPFLDPNTLEPVDLTELPYMDAVVRVADYQYYNYAKIPDPDITATDVCEVCNRTHEGMWCIPPEELVHYVVSANYEFLASDGMFSQIAAATESYENGNPAPAHAPLGDGKCCNNPPEQDKNHATHSWPNDALYKDDKDWETVLNALKDAITNNNELTEDELKFLVHGFDSQDFEKLYNGQDPTCRDKLVLHPGITIPQIRVTLVIVEDYGERSERTISRVIRIPTSGQ